jgi:hypothetical protein
MMGENQSLLGHEIREAYERVVYIALKGGLMIF